MKKRIFYIGLIGTLLLVTAVYSYVLGYIRFNYPDRNSYPVMGIDISHHQGEIHWGAVASENIKFVYMKATEGGDFKDIRFKRNWDKAGETSLQRGAYHFFTFCRSGADQAANFIDSVPVDPNALPPVIDFEFNGNCSEPPDRQSLLQEVQIFAETIEKHYGKQPVFYVTPEAYTEYLAGEIDNYRIWIRAVFSKPDLPAGQNWSIWQFSDTMRISGIMGPVDHNVFNGSATEFELFANATIPDHQ